MKPGELIRVKPGYYSPEVSPYGVILKEIPNIRAVASGDMFRTFHVAFPDGVFAMMAYEFEIAGPENADPTTYDNLERRR